MKCKCKNYIPSNVRMEWAFLCVQLFLTQQHPLHLAFLQLTRGHGWLLGPAAGAAEVLHQGDLVLAAEVHELDLFDFVVEVDALAGRVHTAVGGLEIRLETAG